MVLGSIDSIETLGLVDGPGIRVVIFLNGCPLRCKYCHNPEMWVMREKNIEPSFLVKKIKRYKPYMKDIGGVTFSGGEPLLQTEFLIEVCKLLKQENISVALDTCGVGTGNYEEILSYVDLIIFDVKHVTREGYKALTNQEIDESLHFLEVACSLNKKFWIRQVIVPGITDSISYINKLKSFVKTIKNVERVEFLPFHTLGKEKYQRLGIPYPLIELSDMDKDKCDELYKYFSNQD